MSNLGKFKFPEHMVSEIEARMKRLARNLCFQPPGETKISSNKYILCIALVICMLYA